MSSGSSLAARFVLLRDTALAESPDTQLPAGTLVQEIKNGSDKPDQLLLQSLESTPGATGRPAFVLAHLEQLQEVSKFLAELLCAEKHHQARLRICRDENWLEEAVHVVADTEVYVSFGQLQLLGLVHWTGALPNLPGKCFGVEVYPSNLIDVSRYVEVGDGSPKFECEPGFGVYVAITQLRLATLHLDEPFPERGKKAFSVRTTKAAEIEAAKKGFKNAQTNGHAGSDHTNRQSSSGFESMDWEQGPQSSDVTPLAKNDRVVWFGGKEPARGTVVYVGQVSEKMHNAVAIEFDQAIGDKQFKGMNNDHAQFTVSKGYGKVVEMHEVMREKDYGLEDAQQATESGKKKVEPESSSSSIPGLKDRVVWFGPEGQARGLVVFFDKVPGMEGRKFGLRLDERKGDKRFKGEVNGKDLFHCGPGYGVIVDAADIMLERLFDEGHEGDGNDTEKEVAIHDHIFWLNPDEKYEEGAVRFIGEVARKKKGEKLAYIGVEFENPCGQAGFSGEVNKVQLFKCKQNHGMLLPMSERRKTWFTKGEYNRKKKEMTTPFEDPAIISSKLISPVENDGKAALKEKKTKNAVSQEFTTVNNHKDLTIGQRVLAISVKAGQAAQPGKILWMGTIAVLTGTGVFCGLEMDDKVGSVESVTHCGYTGSEKKGFVEVFACKPGHGQFVPVSDVIAADVESASEWQQVKHHKAGANPAHPVCLPSTLTFEAVRPPPLNPGQTVYPPQAPPRSPAWQNGHGLRYPNSGQSVRPPFSQMVASSATPAVERNPWMSAPVAPQPPQLSLRQTVLTFIGNKPVKGVVVYVGQPHFAPHQTYVGIMMFEASDGTTIGANGFVDGRQYFECLANHGLMCLMDEVHAMDLPPVQPQVSVALQQPPTGSGFVQQANGFAAPSRPFLPLQQFPILQRPSVQSEDSVRAAIKEADRLERLENERKSHVAVFSALAAENLAGVEVTVEVGGTKGNVEICPRIPRLFDGEGEFNITSLTMPEVVVWCAAAGFEPKKMKRSVEYLPPLVLHFELTEGFPDRIPPLYQINCNWLSPDKIEVLRVKLADSWKETVRQTEKNILFEAAKLLRYDLLSMAGLEFGILYYSRALGNFDLTDMEPLAGRCVYATDREVQESVDHIIRYDEQCSEEATDKELVECPICITSYPPTQFNVFSTICSHMFCIGCVTNHAKAQVEDNKGDKIQCMQGGCKITVPLHELSDLIEPTVFEQLTLYVNNRLYDEMDDVKRCPSCKGAVIYKTEMLNADQRYITCPNELCNTEYCPHCGKSGHGDQPCLTNEQKAQLRQEYLSATAEGKQALEQRYGAENIRHAIEDFDSEELIRKMKACPSCKSPVEKSEGCNKMICQQCKSFFCFICGIKLPEENPYSHFDQGGCRNFDHQ